ncbi:MAG: hypothetical protein WCC87_01450 [Candidatus Korobacteraceae bacterium]
MSTALDYNEKLPLPGWKAKARETQRYRKVGGAGSSNVFRPQANNSTTKP